MAFVSAPSLNSRFTQLVLAAAFLITCAFVFVSSFGLPRRIHTPAPAGWHSGSHKPSRLTINRHHPINELVINADHDLLTLLEKETKTVAEAAQAYRDRRGRQPPPAFDAWFAFAQNKSALIVEDFFDQIYHDTAPFWSVPAKQIREQANGFIHRVSVRQGNVTQQTDVNQRVWMDLWRDMVASVIRDGGVLPDVDMMINLMDESRVVVPWEEIDGYMEKEKRSRNITPKGMLKGEYQSLKSLDRSPPELFDPEWNHFGPYWPQVVVGCPQDSPARKAYIETSFSSPPPLPSAYPAHSFHGYVQNWTLAKSPCDNPDLQGLHGTFVEPISLANSKKFFPLFGGSKLPMNNAILLPPAMYWTDDPFYSGGQDHGAEWEQKKDMLVWRGAASGGRNTDDNWTRFQRHRFVSMVNATSIKLAETGGNAAPNFNLEATAAYNLTAPNGSLADWVSTWSDAAVVHLLCFPDPSPPGYEYTNPYFKVAKYMSMSDQYAYKYLPDIDGNSFSGRYRGFLGSTSLPIKATIYQEWHDSRLVPWKHFLPMDNTFVDIYGLMEYFVGNEEAGLAGHDEVAKAIALDGKAWAERVLRREDMQVYVYRLLLEYARICDDDRERMGWAGDLADLEVGEVA